MLRLSARPTPAVVADRTAGRTPFAVRAAPFVAPALVALNTLDLLTTRAILALSTGREAIPWYGYPSMPVYVVLKLATPLALLAVILIATQRRWRATAFTVAYMLLFIAIGMALVVANNCFWLVLAH